jgi:hypothetical protein
LALFYCFSLVYLNVRSMDFIKRGRLDAIALHGGINQLGQIITITRPAHFIRGWSVAEGTGVWSKKPRAVIAIGLGQPPAGDLQLEVKAFGYTRDTGEQQIVAVAANGRMIDTWRFDHGHPPTVKTARIPRDVIGGDGLVRIDFDFCCAQRPIGSNDRRRLGLHLLHFRVSDALAVELEEVEGP